MNKTMIGELMRQSGESADWRPRCSIVIRAYNEEKHIKRLLEGINQQSIQDLEVVLVDSGSTDATVAHATAFSTHFPIKVVHVQPEKFTFGYSLNQGIEKTNGEIIVIASAHVYPVYPDWLERLLSPFDEPRVALVYGKQRGNTINKFSEHQIFARWYPDASQARQPHPFCNNANAAIRRDCWKKHPYDETLTGLEDLAWGRWAIENGYFIDYIAEAEVIHVHNETPREIYNRYRREAISFKRIFPQEHFHIWDFVRLYVSNVSSDLWQAARNHQLLQHISSILWFRFMQFWGTYQGFLHSGPLTWQLRQTFFYPRGIRAINHQERRQMEPIRYKDAAG